MEKDNNQKKMPLSRWLILLLACGMFLFSGFQILSHLYQDRQSQAEQQALIDQAVVIVTTPTTEAPEEEPQLSAEAESTEQIEPEQEIAQCPPIMVDFAALLEENPDIVAWLYSEGTVINYPVVQGTDNQYYVDRLPDGSYNPHGSIFMDFRNLSDFSDYNTIFYGHNMSNDTMFGTLQNYNSQDYYENHPYMWIITADAAYRLELFAGLVVASDSEAYHLFNSTGDLHEHLEYCLSQSVFDPGQVDLEAMNHVVTLSTCSYEFATARFVLLGNLVPAEYPGITDATEP